MMSDVVSDDRAQLAERARAIIDSPNVFQAAVDVMGARGFAGDPRQVELLYAIFTSRLLARPMCAFLKAPSSAGKSWLLNRTLELFPPDSYELKSGFSPKAIAYGSTDLRHKILAIQEASGLNGREGNMLVRTLISEGQVRWEVAGRTRDGFTTREVVRPGPIAFVLTTTYESLHGEDETRALSIQVEDTKEHTRQVMLSIGRRFAGGAAINVDLRPWHAFQGWLEAGPQDVLVPFATALGSLFMSRANRAKRDFEQLLTAIQVSALLHQSRRESDADGHVIATLDDYNHARRLLYRPLNEAIGSAIPIGVRDLVEQLLEVSEPVHMSDADKPWGLSVEELAQRMSVDRSSASRRVQQAIALGLAADLGSGGTRPRRVVVMQPLPADWDVMPEPEYIEPEMRGELQQYLNAKAEAARPAEEAAWAARQEAARQEIAERKRTRHAPKFPEDFESEERIAARRAELERAEALRAALGGTEQAEEAGDASEGGEPAASDDTSTQAVPEIIRNAPRPDQPDGGYRSRRAISQFRTARSGETDK
jgi:hypothetical protein